MAEPIEDTQTRESKLAHNEQTKLLANLLNSCAAAILSIWVLAPLAAAVYTGSKPSVFTSTLVGVPPAFIAALVLHKAAQRVLRRLKE